jgi:hypothetical protein
VETKADKLILLPVTPKSLAVRVLMLLRAKLGVPGVVFWKFKNCAVPAVGFTYEIELILYLAVNPAPSPKKISVAGWIIIEVPLPIMEVPPPIPIPRGKFEPPPKRVVGFAFVKLGFVAIYILE